MPHKARKIRKQRGSRTCGWGQIGQHRKGNKGRRRVGLHKGGWTYITKYEPDYFGKKGFTSQQALRGRDLIINVGALDNLVYHLTLEKKVDKKGNKVLLDLDKLGFDKLLGNGKVTQPLIVKIPAHSRIAAKKISDAGGQILKETENSKAGS